MPIRFHCPSCRQPIEVDDEWASATVACPYCQRHVTAPSESTLDATDPIPTAAPLTAPDGASLVWAGGTVRPGADHPNGIAIVALALGVMTVACFTTWRITIDPYLPQLQAVAASGGGLSDMMQSYEEVFADTGGMPLAVVAGMVCELIGIMGWFATIVCGVIALRRARRRQLAVTALVITGLVPILFCCGVV